MVWFCSDVVSLLYFLFFVLLFVRFSLYKIAYNMGIKIELFAMSCENLTRLSRLILSRCYYVQNSCCIVAL